MKTIACQIYLGRAKTATERLVDFISGLAGKPTLCVTYFDEADGLKELFWILLRLANQQDAFTRMWYVFMSTKSSAVLWIPIPENSEFVIRISIYDVSSRSREFSTTPR
jgi:hypothetical protein